MIGTIAEVSIVSTGTWSLHGTLPGAAGLERVKEAVA